MNKDKLKLFLKIFFSTGIFFSIILTILFKITYTSEMEKLKVREREVVNGHSAVTQRIIGELISDILFISKLPDIRDKYSSYHIEDSLLEISRSKKIYDQIRFINIDGDETIRINWNNGNPVRVQENELQNKAHRYYFKDSIILNLNEIYFSPMDLNIENGDIEKPYKPMIRISTPVYDNDKNKIGVVVINYLAKDLIDELKSTLNNSYSYFYLLNQDGYWLSSNRVEDEWGFMFTENEEITFQNKFNNSLWGQIKKIKNNQYLTENGLFTFNTIYPINTRVSLTNVGGNKEYHWIIMSYIDKRNLKSLFKDYFNLFIFISLLILVFTLLISYFLARSITRRKTAEHNRAEFEKRYRILFEEAGESIVVTKLNKTIMANKRSSTLFEFTEEELLHMPLNALLHPKFRTLMLEKEREFNNSDNNSMIFESKIFTKSGLEKWAEIRVTKLDFYNSSAHLYFFLDITKRKKMEIQLQNLVNRDPLTNCYNRRYFTAELNKEITRIKREDHKISIIMADLDKFKNVNDLYGHDIGDEVIKKFVEIANKEIRDIDTLGRLGGEEFAILLPTSDGKNASLCAERLRLAIEHSSIKTEDNKEIKFTVSIGVTEINQKDISRSVLKRVDLALYQAKDSGRNTVILI